MAFDVNWRCDYCEAEYQTRPERCPGCSNPNLRPPGAEPAQNP